MVELVSILTQTETLLESNMLGTLIACYIFLFVLLFVSFLNIYSVDKYEFLSNKQKYLEFKRSLFFIITYSKEKRIVSKKTFFLELIGYILLLISIAVFIYSLAQTTKTAFMHAASAVVYAI